ncbi:MAG: methyltransferase domain-containing protein [Acidobacteria bacterium]|nr:methyltransferase domain-containing protein [Acidobacteriota bacterium]
MNALVDEIRDDFDRIALLTERFGSAGNIYHNYIRRHLPLYCENALEIGCGTGEFTRLLATRAGSVLAIDLSPQMIRLAQQQSANYPNIEYMLGDAMRLSLPVERYDCIVSLATLHHLQLEQALLKIKRALKTDGVLIIHDLVADEGFIDGVSSALAYPISAARRFWKTGRLRAPREVRDAWAEHGKGEVYLTLNEVGEMCRKYLPQARIQRHLMWRYTVVWHRRGAA